MQSIFDFKNDSFSRKQYSTHYIEAKLKLYYKANEKRNEGGKMRKEMRGGNIG